MVLENAVPLAIDEVDIITDPHHKVVEVSQTYRDKKTKLTVMHNYALEHRFQFYSKRSDKESYELICKVENCRWYFRASKIKDSRLFKVRVFENVHTCSLTERDFGQRQATTRIVAAVAVPQLKNYKRKHTRMILERIFSIT